MKEDLEVLFRLHFNPKDYGEITYKIMLFSFRTTVLIYEICRDMLLVLVFFFLCVIVPITVVACFVASLFESR